VRSDVLDPIYHNLGTARGPQVDYLCCIVIALKQALLRTVILWQNVKDQHSNRGKFSIQLNSEKQ